jgi:hypothetical protein
MAMHVLTVHRDTVGTEQAAGDSLAAAYSVGVLCWLLSAGVLYCREMGLFRDTALRRVWECVETVQCSTPALNLFGNFRQKSDGFTGNPLQSLQKIELPKLKLHGCLQPEPVVKSLRRSH